MLYQTLMEINSEIAPIIKEDFSSQIKSGRRQTDKIRDFMQVFIILAKRVLEEAEEIISQLCACTDAKTLETYKENDGDKAINPNIMDTLQKKLGLILRVYN